MKKVVPYEKTITFKTMISEITSVAVKHTLELKDTDEVEGDILIDGTYKTTDASLIEEEFHYKLPFVIAIDSKYDVSNLDIQIDDFKYEILNEDTLKIDASIVLDNIEEKQLVRNDTIEIPFETDEIIEKLEIDEKKEVEDKNEKMENSNNVVSIFSSLASNEETFSTYHVYIVRDSDTIEGILDKYNISRELLNDYNDLDNVNVGTKLIIPCSND